MVSDSAWPDLRVEDWQPTRDTLTLWLQVVGKIRIARTPLLNHWWNAPLYLTAWGLTTSLMPAERSPSTSISSGTGSTSPPPKGRPSAWSWHPSR